MRSSENERQLTVGLLVKGHQLLQQVYSYAEAGRD